MAALYGFAYSAQSLSYLKTIPKNLRRQIIKKVQSLANDPRPPSAKIVRSMTNSDDKVYRVRSGDYRILYVVREVIIVILDIDHRKDVYR